MYVEKLQKENEIFSFVVHAFMRIQPFYDAFLICIRTVEYSDPSLLIDIDPKLVKTKILFTFYKTHIPL
jgi:hypothetical protein